jgi:hypothetical protein
MQRSGMQEPNVNTFKFVGDNRVKPSRARARARTYCSSTDGRASKDSVNRWSGSRMEGYRDPSEVTTDEVETFCRELSQHLQKRFSSQPGVVVGDELKALIVKRVPPKLVTLYEQFHHCIELLAFETTEIGKRIRRYQYIERYKFFFSTPDKEMFQAFQEHTWSNRGGEIYVILERGEALIEFASLIAGRLGEPPSKAAKGFYNDMRNEFNYRLRERHRITHVHERPSLLSRILSLPAEAYQEPAVVDLIVGTVGQLSGMMKLLESGAKFESSEALEEALAAVNDETPKIEDFQEAYLKRVDEEAGKMWRLLTKGLREAVALPAT